MTSPRTAAGRPGRTIALLLLTAVGTINFVDRQILSVLAEPIRQELHLSDTKLGLLTGLSFALFYAGMGVPAAMLADRVNRVRLVAAACLIWSVFTGACAFANSFWQLALARFGVGTGEAGGTAPSLSILADYYPPAKRPAVIGLFTVAGPLGVFIGASVGGWAATQFGWRGAFLLVASIGAVAALILAVVVREPPRGGLDPGHDRETAKPTSLGATVKVFLSRPSLRLQLLAAGLSAFVSYGILNWIPAFLMRVQEMPMTEMARWFGPVAGLAYGIGIWGGGALVNWLGARDVRAYAYVPGIAALITGPSLVVALMASSWQMSLLFMLVPMVTCTMFTAPALALVQNLSPVAARTTATALVLLAFNIVGLGGGPLAIGMISDRLAASGDAAPLRTALICLAPIAVLAALAYLVLSRVVGRDAENVLKEAAA
ncbi:MAG: MFS transporter [Alphaproteobacteria bacterium]|nr:MFS transporter [Alphaproteobacteria bacterium]MBU1516069.1 MFS transporter [Alphaproteobacteria bacterium]MBU2092716.1 MFS transporter [Alphaproteobacteria bacterium]MBU2153759.1 MFS transporter [Alphaproteobacteria bacterium]MBU2363942.1 MFS transporter [Alphaproteobacteria bacterium]